MKGVLISCHCANDLNSNIINVSFWALYKIYILNLDLDGEIQKLLTLDRYIYVYKYIKKISLCFKTANYFKDIGWKK